MERKWSARLTHEYMDGGATICAENEIDAVDCYVRHKFTAIVPFFLREAIHSAVHVFMGEADEIASQNSRLLR